MLQERLYSWLGGLRASDICGGLIHKLSESGLASQQRMKLEALRVSILFSGLGMPGSFYEPLLVFALV